MFAKLPVFDKTQYPDDLELKLLQVVHRHGERTPVRKRLTQLFPGIWSMCDANKAMFATVAEFNDGKMTGVNHVPLQKLVDLETNEEKTVTLNPGACHDGQLTNLGRYRMTLLGQSIRDVYINRLNFLPDMFDQKSVYFRSTDYIRTQESIHQMVTGGLYPKEKRRDDFVFKLTIRDAIVDNMLPNPFCHRLNHLSREFTKTVSDMLQDKFASLSKRLEKYVPSVSLESHPSSNGLMDTLVAAKAHGFQFPDDIDDQVIMDLEDATVKEWFYGYVKSQEVRRLGVGGLMGVIRDRMVSRAQHTEKDGDLKLAVYSGHDTTVAPLLIMLDGFNDKWPPFGSAILFELFKKKDKEEHFVRVKYNENTLKLPGCAKKGNHKDGDESLCTLEAFQQIVKDQVPQDWAKECKA